MEKEKEEYLEKVKKEPFARYEIDGDLDKELKEKDRFGDPLDSIDKKRIYSKAAKCEKISPNRYNIKAGKMWDNVDRSNGYEERLLKMINEKEPDTHKMFTSRPLYVI